MRVVAMKQKQSAGGWMPGALGVLGVVIAAGSMSPVRAEQFMKPTPEELSMTSVPRLSRRVGRGAVPRGDGPR